MPPPTRDPVAQKENSRKEQNPRPHAPTPAEAKLRRPHRRTSQEIVYAMSRSSATVYQRTLHDESVIARAGGCSVQSGLSSSAGVNKYTMHVAIPGKLKPSSEAEHARALFPVGQLVPFVLVTVLFFLWGIPANLNDVLIRQFMKSFTLTRTQAGLVQFAFYVGYFFLAMPAALLMRKAGYKT